MEGERLPSHFPYQMSNFGAHVGSEASQLYWSGAYITNKGSTKSTKFGPTGNRNLPREEPSSQIQKINLLKELKTSISQSTSS